MAGLSIQELKLQKAVLNHALEREIIDKETHALSIQQINNYEIENYKKKRNDIVKLHSKLKELDIVNLLKQRTLIK